MVAKEDQCLEQRASFSVINRCKMDEVPKTWEMEEGDLSCKRETAQDLHELEEQTDFLHSHSSITSNFSLKQHGPIPSAGKMWDGRISHSDILLQFFLLDKWYFCKTYEVSRNEITIPSISINDNDYSMGLLKVPQGRLCSLI